jgi:hypothetical protein
MSPLQHAALCFPLLGTLDKLLIFTMKSFSAIINQAEGVQIICLGWYHWLLAVGCWLLAVGRWLLCYVTVWQSVALLYHGALTARCPALSIVGNIR